MSDDMYSQPATMWFDRQQALKELFELKFAVASLATLAGTPGSFERENAKNIVRGIERRIDYLHDSLRRLTA